MNLGKSLIYRYWDAGTKHKEKGNLRNDILTI